MITSSRRGSLTEKGCVYVAVGRIASVALVGLGFTPLHLLYLYLRGKARRRNLFACLLENILAFYLLVSSVRHVLHAPPAKTRQQQRRQVLGIISAAILVFAHAFIVAAQVTALALMGSRMNGDFIYNLVYAVKTCTWRETDAKYFFPLMLSATLAIEMVWLWYALPTPRSVECRTDKNDDTAADKIQKKMSARQNSTVNRWYLALSMVGLLRGVVFWRGYSPVANTLYSLVQYSQMKGPSSLKRSQKYGSYIPRKAHKIYKYDYASLPERVAGNAAEALGRSNNEEAQIQKQRKETNVILLLSESFGNSLLKTEEGLEAFPFYENVVQRDPDIYDFTNNRAVSGNTLTAASAALVGSYVAAPDLHPDTWTFFDLPNLFTLGKALGYRLVLFMPYDHEDWFPFTGIHEDRFDKIVSRSTLGERAVNDMGMDDRLVTAEVLKFLEEEGAKQRRHREKELLREQRASECQETYGEWPHHDSQVGKGDGPQEGEQEQRYHQRNEQEVGYTGSEYHVESEHDQEEGGVGEVRRQHGTEASEDDDEEAEKFILVVFWNHLHTPFLVDDEANPINQTLLDLTRASNARKQDETTTMTESLKKRAAASAPPKARPRKTLVPPDVRSTSSLDALTRLGMKEDRAVGAMQIGDKMMQDVYDTLQSSGLLENTLISFQSDHGETAGPVVRKRLADPDSLYLATPLWMHIPPTLLTDTQRATLRANGDRLTSNMDVMPTFVEILGWESADSMFDGVPSIFKHGDSLLRPVEHDRVTSGWQGPPFVDSCDWAHGFVFNASHTLILRVPDNDAVLEALDKEDGTWTTVKQRVPLKELPGEELVWWMQELQTNHADMMKTMKECFWDYLWES